MYLNPNSLIGFIVGLGKRVVVWRVESVVIGNKKFADIVKNRPKATRGTLPHQLSYFNLTVHMCSFLPMDLQNQTNTCDLDSNAYHQGQSLEHPRCQLVHDKFLFSVREFSKRLNMTKTLRRRASFDPENFWKSTWWMNIFSCVFRWSLSRRFLPSLLFDCRLGNR